MNLKSITHLLLIAITFLFVGCKAGITSNVKENEAVNRNDISISFASYGDIQKIAFKFDEVSFRVNDIDRKDELTITQTSPNIKAVFKPKTPLPEGNHNSKS